MIWKQIGNDYVARGKNGKFYIRKNGKYYYASYIGYDNYFQFPRNSNLKVVKIMCEDNFYWEEDEKAPIPIENDTIDF